MSMDPDGRPEWEPMPHQLEMSAMCAAGHFYLHMVDGSPRVLVWRKVRKTDGGPNRLEKRWTVLAELPDKTRAKFEQALAEWPRLSIT
jgi:hypothetical protein